MASYKSKLKTLNKILRNYKKHYGKYDSISCYMEYDFIIVHFIGKTKLFQDRREKIPKNDIDITIKRYRDKLRYEQDKLSENKEKTNTF